MAKFAKNQRGRVYQCKKCTNNIYKGEISKVLLHFYRKHVAIDSVPFYCNICKFVITSEKELLNHVLAKHFLSHLATVNVIMFIINRERGMMKFSGLDI